MVAEWCVGGICIVVLCLFCIMRPNSHDTYLNKHSIQGYILHFNSLGPIVDTTVMVSP